MEDTQKKVYIYYIYSLFDFTDFVQSYIVKNVKLEQCSSGGSPSSTIDHVVLGQSGCVGTGQKSAFSELEQLRSG